MVKINIRQWERIMKNILSLLMGAVLMVVMTSAGKAQLDSQSVSVLVHTAKPYKSVIRAIKRLGGTVNVQYVNVDGLAVEISVDALAALTSISGVAGVEKDMIINLPKPKENVPNVNIFQADIEVADTKGKRGKKPVRKNAGPAAFDILDAAAVSNLIGSNPESYYSYLASVTGAADTWDDTGAGDHSIVAVIDTGTWAGHGCLTGRVIEGPDFSTDADDAIGFEGSVLATNHWHGTFVGGVVANNCAIVVPAGHPIEVHLPGDAKFDIGGGLFLVPVLGMAPASSIYAVKVFPATGAGAANFRISAAIDHVISAKLSGAVDVDVINMSLGGATLFDGRTLQEQLVDAATAAGITVVISSGNEGPSPASVAAPGTAYTALTVAAGTDPVHTRIFWDVSFGADAGVLMYPDDERGVSDFSNRGPSADGRNAVDIIAVGVFNFSGFTPPFGGGLGWASGTSFSAPTVAGAAALLASWRNIEGVPVGALGIKNALTDGAVPIASAGWPFHAQGHGWVQVRNSLDLLQAGDFNNGVRHDSSGTLKPNILLGGETEHTETITVKRGRTFDFLLEITEETETVEVIIDLDGPVAPGPAPIPNSWELYIKSAKHGGMGSLVDTANIFDDASVLIGDGTIALAGAIFTTAGTVVPAPMEPGIMKVVLEPDWTNNVSELTATVTIRRTNGPQTSNAGGISFTVAQDDFGVFDFAVPEGVSRMILDLSWKHDWSKDATNDLDLLVVGPSGPVLFDGATLNAPERQIVDDPEAGNWLFAIDGFTVNKGRDPAILTITFEHD